MKTKCFLTVLLTVVLLNGCAIQQGQRASVGALVGSAGGALVGQIIGHDTESTLVGAAVGTMVGYMVGNEMDKFDRQQLNNTYNSVPSGQTVSWVNPDTGNQYSVTPQPAYQTAPSAPVCREAEIVATIDGRQEKTYTTACRENGRWVIQ